MNGGAVWPVAPAARPWPVPLLALGGALALSPLFLRPGLALVAGAVAVVAWLASRSVAYPLAIAGIPPIMFGIFGDNPLPEGAVTIGLGAAVVLAIAVAAQRGDEVPPPPVVAGASLVLSVLLFFVLVVRQPILPETNYGEIKTAFFVVANVVFLVGGIFVGWSAERLRILLIGLLVVSVGGAVLLVLHVAGGGTQSILPVPVTFSDGDHSISMGRQMAAGALIALAIVLGRTEPGTRLLAAASLPLLLTALIASGARGPIVALIGGALVLVALGLRDRVARRRMLAVVLAGAAAAFVVSLAVPEASVVRSFSFATTDIEGSSSGRTEMWRQSWQIITEEPGLGIGTGGYADVDRQMIYPHNLLLEAGVELGIAGVLLVVLFLGHATWRMLGAYRAAGVNERVIVAAVLGLFAAAVANSMFSFALHSNWEVWMWAGIGTGLAARLARER